jgi:hypothetical protein
LDGLAEWFSLSNEEPPGVLQFRVNKFRKNRDAGHDAAAASSSTLRENKGSPDDDQIDQIAEQQEIDRRFAERRIDEQSTKTVKSYDNHIKTAANRARKIMESYHGLQELVDIILGVQDEKLPIEK